MAKNFFNRVKVATTTSGTGSITLGAAAAGYLSFSEAGVSDGALVSYCIEEGSAFEIGRGVYTSSTSTLSRAQIVAAKTSTGVFQTTPITLAGNASLYLTASGLDIHNLNPVLSVERFGAKGDGTTNDAAAFIAAVAAAEASSDEKIVYVPHKAAGYVLGQSIPIPSGVTIMGDNVRGCELSRIKPASGYTGVLFTTKDYDTARVLRPSLRGLYLDGSATTLTAVAMRCQEAVIRDLTIKNCHTYGITIGGIGSGATQQALNNHIGDCYLAGTIGGTEFFDGIFIDYNSADNTIMNCYVEACKNSGIRTRGYNNKITNNHIYGISALGSGSPLGVGIHAETSADHDISQNYIELCAGEGVVLAGGGGDVATMTAVVHGNVFRNIDTGNTSNGVIEISGSNVSAVTVTGNAVRRDAATTHSVPYFVYFNGITPALRHVSGNVWQDGVITTGETSLPSDNKITSYGAVADDTTNAAAAIQAAHDANTRHVIIPPGVYRTRPIGSSPFDFENQTNDVYRAVALTNGNTVYEGWGARIHQSSRISDTLGGSDLQWVFASDKEVDPKHITNIDYVGIWFDPENNADGTNSQQRFLMTDGVSNLRLFGTTAQSTGNRRGYYAHLHNGDNIQVTGHLHNKVTGGFNFRYTNRVLLSGCIFDDASEAIDFDGRQWQSIVNGAHFRSSSRSNQAIDLNSNEDGILSNITFVNLGNMCNVNNKITNPDTYAEYIVNGAEGHPVKNFPDPARNILSNFTGRNIGNTANSAIAVGWDWDTGGSHAGVAPVNDLIIQNVLLRDTTTFLMLEARDTRLDGISLRDVIVPAGYAPIYGSSFMEDDERIAYSDMDVVLSNIDIQRSDAAGIQIKQSSRVLLENIRIRDINSMGINDPSIRVSFMGSRGSRVKASNLDVSGNVTFNGEEFATAVWGPDVVWRYDRIARNGAGAYRAITIGKSASSGGPSGTGSAIIDDGSATVSAWAPGVEYQRNALVINGTRAFFCIKRGFSASSGPGPTTNGGSLANDMHIVDGTAEWRNAIAPALKIPDWAVSTAYSVGDAVKANGALYECTSAGTSASSGTGPDATGTGIADGGAEWKNISGAVIWEYLSDASLGIWEASTVYLPNKIVKNGGVWYKSLNIGRSASSGGPTGTNASISDDGSAGIPAWAPSTAYWQGSMVRNGAKVYYCLKSGTSDVSGGPTADDQRVFDGTVIWHNVAVSAKSIMFWRPGKAYVVGNRVRCNGAIYECTGAVDGLDTDTIATSAANGTGPNAAGTGIIDNEITWKNISGILLWEHRTRPFEVMWDDNNTVNNGTVSLQGDVDKYTFGKTITVPLGALAATGNVEKIVYAPRRPGVVVHAQIVSTGAAAASGTNFRNLRCLRYRGGSGNNFAFQDTAVTGFTAYTPRDLNVDSSNDSDAYFLPGDVLTFLSQSSGTGVALSELSIQLEILEW